MMKFCLFEIKSSEVIRMLAGPHGDPREAAARRVRVSVPREAGSVKITFPSDSGDFFTSKTLSFQIDMAAFLQLNEQTIRDMELPIGAKRKLIMVVESELSPFYLDLSLIHEKVT